MCRGAARTKARARHRPGIQAPILNTRICGAAEAGAGKWMHPTTNCSPAHNVTAERLSMLLSHNLLHGVEPSILASIRQTDWMPHAFKRTQTNS